MPGFPVGIFTKKGFPICQKKLKLDNKLGTEKGIQRNIEGKYEKKKEKNNDKDRPKKTNKCRSMLQV